MKAKIFLTIAVLFFIISAFSQKPTIELSFTAKDNADYVQLDRIDVVNLTQVGDTSLFYPDTVLLLDYLIGIPQFSDGISGLKLYQNYPNPAKYNTTISLFVPEKDEVSILITDMQGSVLLRTNRVLEKGMHSFRYSPGKGTHCFITAQWRGESSSIKILQTTQYSNAAISLEYLGSENISLPLKITEAVTGFPFSLGDVLLFIGYSDTLQSGMLHSPQSNHTFTFQFATNIPCPGIPTVDYGGQIYNTIQILGQCWLKENLNIGLMISGDSSMKDDGVIERYCYNNEPDSCLSIGALYSWNEMMQYTTQEGVQGICPPGWHIPTDNEWKILEGAIDSQFGIADPIWDSAEIFRGYDAGKNLKTSDYWYSGDPGTDLFGFSALPGGTRQYSGDFDYIRQAGFWWTSTILDFNHDWARTLNYDEAGIKRYDLYKNLGISVRCLKDN